MNEQKKEQLKPAPANRFYVSLVVLLFVVFVIVVRGRPLYNQIKEQRHANDIAEQYQAIGLRVGSNVQFTLPNGSVVDGRVTSIEQQTTTTVTLTVGEKQYTVPIQSLYISN